MNTSNQNPEVATGSQVGGKKFEGTVVDYGMGDGNLVATPEVIWAATMEDALRAYLQKIWPEDTPARRKEILKRAAGPLQGGVPGLGVWVAQYSVTVVPVAE